MLKGTIIENSLCDTSILKEVQIVRTWESGDWTLHDVRVSPEQVARVGRYLAKGPWYVHFWEPGKDDVIVVFRERTFRIRFSDKATWEGAVEYGRALGIPAEQLDFPIGENEAEVIERLKMEGYEKIYTYSAEPYEVDEEHDHAFDTKLRVLTGEIQIETVAADAGTHHTLKPGDELEIPRRQKHSAQVGPEGCRYIVAERH